jgi:hypothetical protein
MAVRTGGARIRTMRAPAAARRPGSYQTSVRQIARHRGQAVATYSVGPLSARHADYAAPHGPPRGSTRDARDASGRRRTPDPGGRGVERHRHGFLLRKVQRHRNRAQHGAGDDRCCTKDSQPLHDTAPGSRNVKIKSRELPNFASMHIKRPRPKFLMAMLRRQRKASSATEGLVGNGRLRQQRQCTLEICARSWQVSRATSPQQGAG